MKKAVARLLVVTMFALAACGKAPPEQSAAATSAPSASVQPQANATPVPVAPSEGEPLASADKPAAVSETDEEPTTEDTSAGPPTAIRIADAVPPPAPPSQFKEGVNYKKLVPAQPTSVSPGKVEVVEVFWYGCPHCYALDPALETWRRQDKPPYVEFVRVPAIWNDTLRMHARVFYTAEVLGKLDELHSAIFREIHVNHDMLNTVEKISAFFTAHGVSAQDFQKAFSSFAVESKLQRAEVLNQRYRVESVPVFVVNGKYTTDVAAAGGPKQVLSVINDLVARERAT
jgi:thiol:disulfide interchange protein DsbA